MQQDGFRDCLPIFDESAQAGAVKKAFRKDQLQLKNFWIYLAFSYFYPLVCHWNLKIFRFFHFY